MILSEKNVHIFFKLMIYALVNFIMLLFIKIPLLLRGAFIFVNLKI